MIVRISGEDQYRLEGSSNGELNELDRAVQASVDTGDEAAFKRCYQALLDFIRDNGEPLAEDSLEGSDLILPPADITVAEAAEEFTGEGLIPD